MQYICYFLQLVLIEKHLSHLTLGNEVTNLLNVPHASHTDIFRRRDEGNVSTNIHIHTPVHSAFLSDSADCCFFLAFICLCRAATSSLTTAFCLPCHFVHGHKMRACAYLEFHSMYIIYDSFKIFMKCSAERTSWSMNKCRA